MVNLESTQVYEYMTPYRYTTSEELEVKKCKCGEEITPCEDFCEGCWDDLTKCGYCGTLIEIREGSVCFSCYQSRN
jgi:hypothetical protein